MDRLTSFYFHLFEIKKKYLELFDVQILKFIKNLCLVSDLQIIHAFKYGKWKVPHYQTDTKKIRILTYSSWIELDKYFHF